MWPLCTTIYICIFCKLLNFFLARNLCYRRGFCGDHITLAYQSLEAIAVQLSLEVTSSCDNLRF